jgi:glycosyltransferase involved in cell wall biosynthesis
VGCRSGNLRSLITDGQEGCLLPPGDVSALREALGRLAADEGWRNALAAAAHRRGRVLPTWADTAAAFFAALRRLPPEA